MHAALDPLPTPSVAPTSAVVTVLLADDSDRFREGIARAISRHPGLQLLGSVGTGRQALAAAVDQRPDVLVLDHRMPELSGLEVAEHLKQNGLLTTTRVAILTANDDEGFADRARAVGATAVIDKASSRREICQAIHAAGSR